MEVIQGQVVVNHVVDFEGVEGQLQILVVHHWDELLLLLFKGFYGSLLTFSSHKLAHFLISS